MDIHESREAPPEHHVARWQVMGSRKVTAKSGNGVEVMRDGVFRGRWRFGIDVVEQLCFNVSKYHRRRRIGRGTVDHTQPEDTPAHDAVNRQQVG